MTSLQIHGLAVIVPLMLVVCLLLLWRVRRGRPATAWALASYGVVLLSLFLIGCLFKSGFAWTSGLLVLLTMPWSVLFAIATDYTWHGSTVYNNLRLNFAFFVLFCGGLNCLLIRGALRMWRGVDRRSANR